jgi:monoamine oxidase
MVQAQVNAFLNDLNLVFPGIKANASKVGTNFVAHLEHWPTNPNSLGSYTSYKPGQFTGIEGLNSEASGLVKFAGEHTDSFYAYQGFMEGACQSGLRAANEVLADIKAGRI